jgi:hypothetical protein
MQDVRMDVRHTCTWLEVLMPQACGSRFCFLVAMAAVKFLLPGKLSLSSGFAQHHSVPLCKSMFWGCIQALFVVLCNQPARAGSVSRSRSAGHGRPQWLVHSPWVDVIRRSTPGV